MFLTKKMERTIRKVNRLLELSVFGPAPKADYSPTVPEVALDEAEPAASSYSVFLMTLQQTDVGVGQTTPGTSMRSRKYSYR